MDVLLAVIERRALAEREEAMRRTIKRMGEGRRILMFALPFAAFAMSLPGCITNPATGQTYYNALSREEEVAIGEQAAPDLIAQYGGLVADQGAQAYVTGIGEKLAGSTEGDYPTLPWEFFLLDSDVINAFALPGGKVFMSRGLAEKMTNEAQLAGVLGHEIGHVTAQHVDRRVSQQLGAQIGLGAIGILLGGDYALGQQAAEMIAGGVVLKFGRDQELESDRLGMRYMNRVGYSPWGQRQVMEILQAASGTRGGLEIMSTHPYPETRIKQIDALLRTEYPDASPKKKVYPARFRRELLDRLAVIPPAENGRRLAIGAPAVWCAVCAAEGALEQN